MFLRFQYVTQQDKDTSNQWNPPIIKNPTEINQNKFKHFIAQFNINLLDEFPMDWLKKGNQGPVSVLLVHYDPLKKVWDELAAQSIRYQDLEEFRDPNSILNQKYGDQIVTFQNEMIELGERFDLNVLEMADKAELIVCCWGEFMEAPYQEKHVFQGISRSRVFVDDSSEGYFQTQSTSSYS